MWVNDAYLQVCDEVTNTIPDYFTKSATTSAVASQREYELPSTFEKILMVNMSYSGTWVTAKPLPNINFIPVIENTDSGDYSTGSPMYYLIGDKIGLAPIPTINGSSNIKIWYVYSPIELDDADIPDLPKKFHHILKYLAYANYLDQDDEHVAAERMRQRFDLYVQKMVSNLSERQVDEPKSIIVTQNQEFYQ